MKIFSSDNEDEEDYVVKLLLRHKADVNAYDSSANTPLMIAATMKNNTVLEILLACPSINVLVSFFIFINDKTVSFQFNVNASIKCALG